MSLETDFFENYDEKISYISVAFSFKKKLLLLVILISIIGKINKSLYDQKDFNLH